MTLAEAYHVPTTFQAHQSNLTETIIEVEEMHTDWFNLIILCAHSTSKLKFLK